MTAPRRHRIDRRKGARLPEGTIVVARPSHRGNPIRVGSTIHGATDDGFVFSLTVTPAIAVDAFRQIMAVRLMTWEGMHLDDRAESDRWRTLVENTRGHDVACYCALDAPCHGDVWLELANAPREDPTP